VASNNLCIFLFVMSSQIWDLEIIYIHTRKPHNLQCAHMPQAATSLTTGPLTSQYSHQKCFQLLLTGFHASIDPSHEILHPQKLFEESTSANNIRVSTAFTNVKHSNRAHEQTAISVRSRTYAFWVLLTCKNFRKVNQLNKSHSSVVVGSDIGNNSIRSIIFD